MHGRISMTLGVVGLALGVAATASADHENRSRPWWDRNVSRERPDVEEVHWGHGHHRHGYRHGYRRGYHDGHHAQRASYQCGPCRHRYADYGGFERHLHHHHGIPIWRIPQVIVQVAFGWMFYG